MTGCCMGGWCSKRESCADYHGRAWPIADRRLCEKGQEMPRQMPRFDAWLAGATEEHVKRWEVMQQRAAVVEGE